jgi:hypothetical protein
MKNANHRDNPCGFGFYCLRPEGVPHQVFNILQKINCQKSK